MNYIYGCGVYGKALTTIFERIHLEFQGYIVSKRNNSLSLFEGKKVFCIDEIRVDPNTCIFVAIANTNSKSVIWNKLINAGVRPDKIIDCAGLIELNNLDMPRYCNVCGKYSESFLPYGMDSDVTRCYRVVGAGLRPQSICPHCYSTDRTRWLWHLIVSHTRITETDCNVLHFAPEEQIAQVLQSNDIQAAYYPVDLCKGKGSCQVDMTNIIFPDSYFDYIIAGHVLQQIEREDLAIKELKRVLKPEGTIILSIPICLEKATSECDYALNTQERISKYGEVYGVRLYGMDYYERFSQYGLSVNKYIPIQNCEQSLIDRLSIIPDEIVLFCGLVDGLK